MGFFKNLFSKKDKYHDESPFEILDRQINDEEERKRYLSTSFMQMKEISSDIDNLRAEYNVVTQYLNDCDEVDRLPESIRYQVEDLVEEIIKIKNDKEKSFVEKPLIDDLMFDKMDRISDEMPEAYDKLKNAEDFQKLIKSDLKKVEGEKQAYYYRRGEIQGIKNNLKGILIIATVAAVICLITLMILGLAFDMNVKIGFLLTVTIVIAVYCGLFLKVNDFKRESVKLDKTIIKIIQLQNSVKIRLVNNTNLLDYYYMKYDVYSSAELKENFEAYEKERDRRENYDKASKALPLAKRELLVALKNLPLKDPMMWVHTPEALIDKSERVELRHDLITRRQKLRAQIDENTANAENINNELKEMIKRYPEYSVEIMEMMKDFES
ncbi:MAG: hypothetical protein MJ126_06690 [Lachnospiraceae bacterium]|nr:hypothetical protein [Lachnospiraceae bacterium]